MRERARLGEGHNKYVIYTVLHLELDGEQTRLNACMNEGVSKQA